jgi:hypothetical protein
LSLQELIKLLIFYYELMFWLGHRPVNPSVWSLCIGLSWESRWQEWHSSSAIDVASGYAVADTQNELRERGITVILMFGLPSHLI